MNRLIINFLDGSHVNLKADCIDIRDGFVMGWNGEALVVIAKMDCVASCYLSEKKE